jgi:hypothetical protein
VIAVDLDCGAVVGDGAIKIAPQLECVAATEVSGREFGIEGDRRAEVGDGAVEIAFLSIEESAIVIGLP